MMTLSIIEILISFKSVQENKKERNASDATRPSRLRNQDKKKSKLMYKI